MLPKQCHQPACYILWLQIGMRACLFASYISVHQKWPCVLGLKYQTYFRTQALHSQIADCYRVVSGLGMRLVNQWVGNLGTSHFITRSPLIQL